MNRRGRRSSGLRPDEKAFFDFRQAHQSLEEKKFIRISSTYEDSSEPFENAFTGYLSFPGFEIKDKFVRMVSADIC
jgi:hypothetical protein